MMLQRVNQDTVTVHRIELPTPVTLLGRVNVYVLTGSGQSVLIDCGFRYEPAKEVLMNGLSELGLHIKDLTGLVLTHGHPDHVGFASFFQEKGVPVYAHPDLGTWLSPKGDWKDYRMAFNEQLFREMGMPEVRIEQELKLLSISHSFMEPTVVDFSLHDGDRFSPFRQYRIVEVPGHAQAAIALLNEETGDFIAGDQLLPNISSNPLIEPHLDADTGKEAERTDSLLQYRHNLKHLTQLPIRKVFPGHGAPFTEVNELIERRLNEQLRRRDQLFHLLSDMEGCSAYDLALAYFPNHREQGQLILSETLGFLDWMKLEGVVTSKRDENGIFRWWTCN